MWDHRQTSNRNTLPVAGALIGALVWGLIWYPFRALREAGVPGTMATLLTYCLTMCCGLFMFPKVRARLQVHGWRRDANHPAAPMTGGPGVPYPGRRYRKAFWLGILVLSAGWTNFGYVLAVLYGEVMRILLLFYLAPLWTILLAYWLLGERLNRYGLLVISLSLAGAVTMLWRPQLGIPLPRNLAEWCGLSAGISFALSNVVARRAAYLSLEGKSYSVWAGTAALAGMLLCWQGGIPGQLAMIGMYSWLLLGLLGAALCGSTYAMQFALANLSANRAIILFLSELVAAAISSYFLAHEAMQWRDWLGALLIVSASLMSGKLQVASSA